MEETRCGSLAGLLVLCLLLLPCCGERETRPCEYEVPGGRIEGHVRVGTTAVPGVVRAERLPENGQNEAVIDVRPDEATGAYQIDVPAGRYVLTYAPTGSFYGRIFAYRRSGLTYADLPPDTLVADDPLEPVAADFTLGVLTAHLELSPILNGEYVEMALCLPAPGGGWSSCLTGSSEIENGAADILLECVVPDDYKIEIVLGRGTAAHDGEHFWAPGVLDSSVAPSFTIPADGMVDASLAIDPVAARIEGRLTGEWLEMNMSEEPTVALIDTDSIVVVGDRVTGDDGTFGFDVFFPRPVKVRVSQSGFSQWIGDASGQGAEIFPLTRGDTLSGVELVQSGLRLTIDASAVPRYGFLEIGLYHADTHALIGRDSDRRFLGNTTVHLGNLLPGRYRLHAGAGPYLEYGWLAQWYDRAGRAEDAQIIELPTAGEVVDLTVVLEPGGSILGRVLGEPGEAGLFVVCLTPSNDPNPLGASLCTAEEDFEILGLPDGEWKVGAWRYASGELLDPPPGTIWHSGTHDWEAAAVISTTGFAEVTGIEIDLAGH